MRLLTPLTPDLPLMPREPALPVIHLAQHYNPRFVARQVAGGQWERVRRGAYVDAAYVAGAVGDHPAAVQHRRALARIAAVAAQAQTPIVFSHISAALMHGSSVWRVPRRTHVLVPSTPEWNPSGDVVRHTRKGETQVMVTRSGLLVTSAEQTALDCAMTMPAIDGLVIADGVLAAGADHELLASMAAGYPGWRGIRLAREVIELADGRSESPWETASRLCVVSYGLPCPQLQMWITTATGRYRADMGWDEWRLLIEFDGKNKYTTLAGGTPGRVIYDEKVREDELLDIRWRVLRLSAGRDFRAPGFFFARLEHYVPLAALRARRPRPHLLLGF